MTSTDFDKLLLRLNKCDSIHEDTNRAVLAQITAGNCFIDNHPEDADTAELRRQLLSLRATGHFDFSDW